MAIAGQCAAQPREALTVFLSYGHDGFTEFCEMVRSGRPGADARAGSVVRCGGLVRSRRRSQTALVGNRSRVRWRPAVIAYGWT